MSKARGAYSVPPIGFPGNPDQSQARQPKLQDALFWFQVLGSSPARLRRVHIPGMLGFSAGRCCDFVTRLVGLQRRCPRNDHSKAEGIPRLWKFPSLGEMPRPAYTALPSLLSSSSLLVLETPEKPLIPEMNGMMILPAS